MADPEYYKSSKIDILGADISEQLMLRGKLEETDKLFLRKTLFGWVLISRFDSTVQKAPSQSYHVTFQDILFDSEKFWILEELPEASKLTAEQKLCMEHFTETTTRDETGRFVVQIEEEQSYYLPHLCVLKGKSSTTKLRVVFDESAQTSSQVSLNDTLMVGPTIQSDMFDILLRFQFHAIVLSSDIEKMYRQTALSKESKEYRRLLWRLSPEEKISHLRLKLVIYGVRSSAYHATRALQEAATFKLGSEANSIILHDFYVDLMTIADTIEEALHLQDELLDILRQAGIPLRKWTSNDIRLIGRLIEDLRETKELVDLDNDEKAIETLE